MVACRRQNFQQEERHPAAAAVESERVAESVEQIGGTGRSSRNRPAKTARQTRILFPVKRFGVTLWPASQPAWPSFPPARPLICRERERERVPSLPSNELGCYSLSWRRAARFRSVSVALSLSLGLISIINVISGVAGRTAPPSFLPLSAFLVMSFVRPFLALRSDFRRCPTEGRRRK